MDDQAMDNPGDLQAMVTGFRVSAALSVAAELGLSDELAGGPRAVGDLAAAVQADEDTLRRLLRVLVAVGVYAEHDGSFANTSLGEDLRSDRPGSLRPLARIHQDPAIWSAWGHLCNSVRTGATAFEALHGIDLWTHRQRDPEQNAIFNDTMAALSWYVGGAVANAYDFSGLASVVDVGGGQGVLLEAVLARHEHLTGTVFDLPHVVAKEPRSSALESRWSAAAGSFFEAVPAADAYLVKSILHDWPDDRCVQILRSCAAALNPGGVVLVVELVLGRPGNEIEAALSDLNMLVVTGGRERTEAEYAALLDAAGLRLARVVDTGTPVAILEARP
jgi:2-polyprenyl-3-methyl-5-hydroxy-6-metoxy-1,4-benzoquinol methylase